METVKKKRAAIACDQCSRYRRKCDGNSPCVRCVEAKRVCSYIRKNSSNFVIFKSPGICGLNPEIASLLPLSFDFKFSTGLPRPPADMSHTVLRKNFIPNPVASWTRNDFLSKTITDSTGNQGTMLDLYFTYPYQHLPMFSKLWITQNIEDVPMHVLHVMYMNVLVHANKAINTCRETAKPHADYVKSVVNNQIENCDPFLISTMMNLAMFEFYCQESDQSILHLAMAAKSAQILGLDRDIDLLWRSSASGRLLGNEIGMDKQFLRSLWFLMYQWDHNNTLVYKCNMLIDTLIPNYVINSYVPPNIGDPSNIPVKYFFQLIRSFLTHSQYSIRLHSIGKQIFLVDNSRDRMELLYKLDTFHLIMPTNFIPQKAIFLGRTISWINEVYYFSKFCLLVPLYLDTTFIPCDKRYIPDQLDSCINAMLASASAFVTYSNQTVSPDQTFIFFSKTCYVTALSLCMIGKARKEVLEVFVEAMRLSGFDNDNEVIWEAAGDPLKAINALVEMLSF